MFNMWLQAVYFNLINHSLKSCASKLVKGKDKKNLQLWLLQTFDHKPIKHQRINKLNTVPPEVDVVVLIKSQDN